MDRGHFDALARLVSATHSRRSAVAVLLGAALLGQDPHAALAKRRKRKKRRGNNDGGQGEPTPPCFSGRPCVVTQGATLRDCDLSASEALPGANCRGCNLSGANLAGVDARDADLQGAILGDACLVDADLTGANLNGVTLDKVIFCRTTMPDGTRNNSGCGHGTRCCQTDRPQGGGSCAADAECSDDHRCCNGECVDTNSDIRHCGRCGDACPSGFGVCLRGQCRFCDVCQSENCGLSSIQTALDRHNPGTTIRVCAGIYHERLRIEKNVTVVGVGADPSQIVVHGDNQQSQAAVLTIAAGVTANISNLTVTGGKSRGQVGGGITNLGDLTAKDIHVLDNVSVDRNGGGIANLGQNAKLTIENGLLSGNSAGLGGAIFNDFGASLTADGVFFGNKAFESGGAIYNHGGSLTLDNAQVSRNEASTLGGGLFSGGGVSKLTRTRVNNNSAAFYGGGHYQRGGALTIEHSELTDNSALGGGGMFIESGTTSTITASHISNNHAKSSTDPARGFAGQGGGIFNLGDLVLDESTSVTLNTIENPNGIVGGGVHNIGRIQILRGSRVAANLPENCVDISRPRGCSCETSEECERHLPDKNLICAARSGCGDVMCCTTQA